ncbi:hypothetical protein R1flu_003045 [Riccia fluitans]|uniref:5'-3' exonuclease alpha-helical arch N-terminal domain-containing protein n=1 Tax=Riccia fluitans TaxID=41844 RepID=A0ABD1Y824_9MARC
METPLLGSTLSYKGWYVSVPSGQTFRHTLYPEYKAHRSPTPDTVYQAVNYTKAALLSMGMQVVEVPGVEADDVIGTLASETVQLGMKIRDIYFSAAWK